MIRFILALGFFSIAPAHAWDAEIVPLREKVIAVRAVDAQALVQTRDRWRKVALRSSRIVLDPAAGPVPIRLPMHALADGTVASADGPIRRAYFAAPTNRYRHGALGDVVEAEQLVIETAAGSRQIVSAGPEAVFEDLVPRIADVDGDGEPEIVVVKSYLDRGSALVVVGRDPGGGYRIVAETPPIGTPNRWLNPAAIADFDGDGRPEIAVVRMPHVLGRLELWGLRAGALVKLTELPDASNHAYGSRVQQQSAAADFDGDGVSDLAIPAMGRRAMRLISFRGKARDIARVELPAAVLTGLAVIADPPRRPVLVFGLVNGALVAVRNR